MIHLSKLTSQVIVVLYFLSFGKLLLVLPKLLLVQVKFCEPGATFVINLLLVPMTLFQALLSPIIVYKLPAGRPAIAKLGSFPVQVLFTNFDMQIQLIMWPETFRFYYLFIWKKNKKIKTKTNQKILKIQFINTIYTFENQQFNVLRCFNELFL